MMNAGVRTQTVQLILRYGTPANRITICFVWWGCWVNLSYPGNPPRVQNELLSLPLLSKRGPARSKRIVSPKVQWPCPSWTPSIGKNGPRKSAPPTIISHKLGAINFVKSCPFLQVLRDHRTFHRDHNNLHRHKYFYSHHIYFCVGQNSSETFNIFWRLPVRPMIGAPQLSIHFFNLCRSICKPQLDSHWNTTVLRPFISRLIRYLPLSHQFPHDRGTAP